MRTNEIEMRIVDPLDFELPLFAAMFATAAAAVSYFLGVEHWRSPFPTCRASF